MYFVEGRLRLLKSRGGVQDHMFLHHLTLRVCAKPLALQSPSPAYLLHGSVRVVPCSLAWVELASDASAAASAAAAAAAAAVLTP
jgi:hypothetical protein